MHDNMAKQQVMKPQPPAPPTRPSPGRWFTPMLVGALVIAALAVGTVWYLRGSAASVDAAQAASVRDSANAALESAPASQTGPPANAKFGPHQQAVLPRLEFPGYATPRPPEVVRAAYTFAAEHPEVLGYVPCFCGCQRSGHRGNDDCFVAARAANGDVTSWEPHGMECQICIDVAHQAEQLHKAGASVGDIRAAVDKAWSPRYPIHTPTPVVPK